MGPTHVVHKMNFHLHIPAFLKRTKHGTLFRAYLEDINRRTLFRQNRTRQAMLAGKPSRDYVPERKQN